MTTGSFRASYAHVFQPQTPQGGGEPKFQITMLFPKSDLASYQALWAAINQALQDGVPKVFNGQMPAKPKLPLYDGDGVRDNGEPFGEECRGCWVLRASSKTRPSVVDLELQPILDPNAFYSGCFARASIHFFAYNQNGNRGIGCGLNNVQKLADGEPLSGRTTVEEDFGGRNAWNGSSTYGMPLTGTHPPMPPMGYGGQPQTGPAPSAPVWGAAPARPVNSQDPAWPGYPQDSPAAYGGQAAAAPATDPVTGRPFSGSVMGI